MVTGSNGLLGQKIIDAYGLRNDITLIATGKGIDRHEPKGGYIYESLDITNQIEVDNILTKYQPKVVINTAAMTNVDLCETDKLGCDALNVDAVNYLVNACNKIEAHLVHVSTDFVFDGTHGPLSEDEIPNPISYYGKSKLLGEQIVMENATNWTIIRAILVYGVVHDMSRSNFVLWAKSNVEKGNSINVVDDQFRTPTLAEDLAQGCLLAADKKIEGIFHVGGNEFMSIYEAVIKIADFWKLNKHLINRSKSATINQPAKRPPTTGFKIEKAKTVLGYNPRTFEEGLLLMDEQLKKIKVN